MIPRIQTEKPRLVLLWLHLSGDADGSKLGSGGGSQCVWWLYCSTYSIEELLADAPLGTEGQDLTWFPLLAWDGPGPTHSLEGRFLDIGRCFCLCGFSLHDLYQMKFPSPLGVSSWVHWTHMAAAATAAKLLQSCPTLCDPIDGSLPGSAIPGILQARTLEWVAISFSNAWKWKVKVKSLNRVWLFATPWTAAYQAPLSMGFSKQEYWSGVPLPSPELTWLWEGNSSEGNKSVFWCSRGDREH